MEHLGSYYEFNETGAESLPALDNAYQSLLEQRDNLIIPVTNTSITISEDDLLINKNLQTVSLFNRLNDEYKQKQIKLDEYNSQLQIIQDSTSKLACMIDTIRKTYVSNDVESLNSLNEISDTVIKYFRDTNPVVSDIVRRKIMNLETELEDITRKLNALRSLIVTGVNEIVKPEDVQKKMCPVCFESEVCMALVPCGHTYCKSCSEMDRSRHAKCPQCRSIINSRVKIFFSI